MRRAWMLSLVAVAGCRPDVHGTRLQVPLEDAVLLEAHDEAPRVVVQVPPGSTPRVLRPHSSVKVQVPADEPLPRGIRPD